MRRFTGEQSARFREQVMYFSAQTGGFYDPEFHGLFEPDNPDCMIPGDAVEVSCERWIELLAGNTAGKIIAVDSAGFPMLADPPPPSAEDLVTVERSWRDQRLSETDGVVTRHRDELEDGSGTTLTSAQYAELQAYRRALRRWPEAGEFPLIEYRPPAPEWLSTLTQ